MILYCDFFDSTGVKIYQPVLIETFNYSLSLDNINSGSMSLNLLTHNQIKSSLSVGTTFSVVSIDENNINTIIFNGVITRISTQIEELNVILKISFSELTKILDNRTVGLRREFRNVTVSSVINELLTEIGWTFDIEPEFGSKLITVRFDGQTYYGAISSICEKIGCHIRQSDSILYKLELGYFGENSGFALTQLARSIPSSKQQSINNISYTESLDQITNLVIALGGGQGLASLTLEDAPVQIGGYEVQTRIQGGQNIYYLSSPESITNYGQLERIINLSDITPIDNTDVGISRAKDLLYTTAYEFLVRNKDSIIQYDVSITGCEKVPKIASKIHLKYNGYVYDRNLQSQIIKQINNDFWLTSINVSYSNGLFSINYKLSSQDMLLVTTEKIIAGAIRDVRVANLSIQPYPTTYGFVYPRQIDSTHSARVPINLTNGILYLDRVLISFITRPFRATATGAEAIEAVVGTTSTTSSVVGTSGSGGGSTVSSASGGSSTPTSSAGGDHAHRMFLLNSIPSYTKTSKQYEARTAFMGALVGVDLTTSVTLDLWTEGASGNHTHDISIPAHTHNVTIAAHTHDVTIPAHNHDVTVPAHAHDLIYGIVDDVQTPDEIGVRVNGIDRTIVLGGPWGVGGGEIEQDIEISEYLNNAVGGMRQKHIIEFFCIDGQGEIELTVEIKATVQSVQQI